MPRGSPRRCLTPRRDCWRPPGNGGGASHRARGLSPRAISNSVFRGDPAPGYPADPLCLAGQTSLSGRKGSAGPGRAPGEGWLGLSPRSSPAPAGRRRGASRGSPRGSRLGSALSPPPPSYSHRQYQAPATPPGGHGGLSGWGSRQGRVRPEGRGLCFVPPQPTCHPQRQSFDTSTGEENAPLILQAPALPGPSYSVQFNWFWVGRRFRLRSAPGLG